MGEQELGGTSGDAGDSWLGRTTETQETEECWTGPAETQETQKHWESRPQPSRSNPYQRCP